MYLDLLILIFILYLLFNTKFVSFNDEYLSIDRCQTLKGVSAIFVIIHHLSQGFNSNNLLFHFFADCGYLFVSIFFFLSGYGVQKQNILKTNYKKNFLSKRVVTILIPYLFFTLLYWLFRNHNGYNDTITDILNSFINGYPYVTFSWYVVSLFLFLVIYFIAISVFKNNKSIIAMVTLFYSVYCIFLYKIEFGSWWYKSCHLFIIGIIWATYEKDIVNLIKKHFVVIILTICFFNIIAYFSKTLLSVVFSYNISVIIEMFQSVLFVFFIIVVNTKMVLKKNLYNFIGKYTLEMYLSQGLIIDFYRNKAIICGEFQFSLLVVFSTIIFSIIISEAYKYIRMHNFVKLCD